MTAERRNAIASALEQLAVALREDEPDGRPLTPPPATVTLPWSVLLYRVDLVPDDVQLSVQQAAEALGMTKAAVYRRTSRWHRENGTAKPLPHARVSGQLRFRAGELRAWLRLNGTD